ncbi:MAG TPA: hypothetical protein VIM71_14650 [Lacunisphaera sp.]
MTPSQTSGRSILKREAIAFSSIIALTWLAEIVYLPHLLYGEPAAFLWGRVLVRTAVILAVWAWVHFATRRLLRRLHELEEFLLVCSWCRKVGHEGRWLTMEEYFGSKFDTETSHGICPECANTLRKVGGDRVAARVSRPPI